MPPAVEAQSVNHWTAREVPLIKGFEMCRYQNHGKGVELWQEDSKRTLHACVFSVNYLHIRIFGPLEVRMLGSTHAVQSQNPERRAK